jgi:aldehyde dehydrogenase (NAD+)
VHQTGRDHPITALKLAEIFQDAGLPPGVVNIVTGFGDTGGDHDAPDGREDRVHRLDRGRQIIMRSLAGTDKKMTLELGGKAANIVFDDAPLDQAVEGIVNGIFFNQGHVCCAGSRLLVHEPVAAACSPSSRTASACCASATRSTRTPTSAPSTRRRSSARSRNSWPLG